MVGQNSFSENHFGFRKGRSTLDAIQVVLASAPLIDFLGKKGHETFKLRKKLTCMTNQLVIARAKEAFRKEERRKLVEIWQTRWHSEQTGNWT